MHIVQTIVTDDCGVCLSRGSTWLHCAKMAEQIKMLFGVNTSGGPGNTGVLIPLYIGVMRPTFECSDPLVSLEWLKLQT